VRVGTENRQHVLGHISLLGYRGRIIAPQTPGGLTSPHWATPSRSCSASGRPRAGPGGIVVVPHFPNPRAEHAAAIVGGNVDGSR